MVEASSTRARMKLEVCVVCMARPTAARSVPGLHSLSGKELNTGPKGQCWRFVTAVPTAMTTASAQSAHLDRGHLQAARTAREPIAQASESMF